MQESLAEYFIVQMQRQLNKREEEGIHAVMVDLRDEGLDFYASISSDLPMKYYCRGTRYVKIEDGSFRMETGDGTALPIDENEYLSRLDYALSCIGASSETGVSVLVKKHIKNC